MGSKAEGDADSDSSFTRRLQSALALSIATDQREAVRPSAANVDAGGSSGSAAVKASTVSAAITPNSAAAAAFDSALVTPSHSRGGSVNFTTIPGACSGLSARAPCLGEAPGLRPRRVRHPGPSMSKGMADAGVC